MAAEPSEWWRRFLRYGAIGTVIAVYFGFHTLAQTALAVLSGGGAVTAVAIALYMGIGLLFDSPASAVAHRSGLRIVVVISGIVVLASSLVGVRGGDLGWWVLLLAAVLAVCSSLIYIPALAHYSALLGDSQARGQRFAVFMQRGGALVASGMIAIALGAARPEVMWWTMVLTGVLLVAVGSLLPAKTSTDPGGVRPGLRSVGVAIREARRSRRLVSGVVVAASMPLVFVLTGSVLVLALPEHGGAVGVGLLVREAVAVVAALLMGRGTLARANREFALTCAVAIVGIAALIMWPSPLMVVLGIATTGPVIASAIVASAWNTNRASLSSEHPWACFAAMGMAARASGLISPFVLSAGLAGGNVALGAVVAVVLASLGWVSLGADQRTTGR